MKILSNFYKTENRSEILLNIRENIREYTKRKKEKKRKEKRKKKEKIHIGIANIHFSRSVFEGMYVEQEQVNPTKSTLYLTAFRSPLCLSELASQCLHSGLPTAKEIRSCHMSGRYSYLRATLEFGNSLSSYTLIRPISTTSRMKFSIFKMG